MMNTPRLLLACMRTPGAAPGCPRTGPTAPQLGHTVAPGATGRAQCRHEATAPMILGAPQCGQARASLEISRVHSRQAIRAMQPHLLAPCRAATASCTRTSAPCASGRLVAGVRRHAGESTAKPGSWLSAARVDPEPVAQWKQGLVDLGPLGARELTGRQSLCLHPAFRVGAAGAETPVNLAWSSSRIPRGPLMDQSAIRVLIQERLAAGRLPPRHIPLSRSGPANGEACDGREEPVDRQGRHRQ